MENYVKRQLGVVNVIAACEIDNFLNNGWSADGIFPRRCCASVGR